MKLRILIADDHEIVRQGLHSILQGHDDWEICGEAPDGRSAIEKSRQLKPDIVIVDLGMPNLNGLDATRQIIHENPNIGVLVLSIDESEQMMREALNAGARGFVLKSDAGRDLVAAVEALRRKRTFFTAKLADLVLSGFLNPDAPTADRLPARDPLTRREREVVQLLAEGKTTKDVAVILNMSVKTAETHRSNIMRKLKLHSVSELVLYAVRNNIVQIPTPITSAQAGAA
jgi:DNA-binding NarL/FixJ family response regulator